MALSPTFSLRTVYNKYYTSTVNCPIRKLDLYRVTSQFKKELPLITWYSSSSVFLAAAGNTSSREYHAACFASVFKFVSA